MPALEPIVGFRVVADPGAMDRCQWGPKGTMVWRTAPDEAFVWHPNGAAAPSLDDDHAIVEPESGFSSADLSPADLEVIRAHVEFPYPLELPALVQGKVGGVPAKLALLPDGQGIALVQTAFADELRSRLGW